MSGHWGPGYADHLDVVPHLGTCSLCPEVWVLELVDGTKRCRTHLTTPAPSATPATHAEATRGAELHPVPG